MADETFKVGEIGILQNLTNWAGRYNGEEAEVVADLATRFVQFLDGGYGLCPVYVVSMGGQNVGVRPSNLRKKRPPVAEKDIIRELEVA